MKLLQMNPDPLRVIPAAQREVWTRTKHRWRCEHEDGRGRCTSRDTSGVMENGYSTFYCEKHAEARGYITEEVFDVIGEIGAA